MMSENQIYVDIEQRANMQVTNSFLPQQCIYICGFKVKSLGSEVKIVHLIIHNTNQTLKLEFPACTLTGPLFSMTWLLNKITHRQISALVIITVVWISNKGYSPGKLQHNNWGFTWTLCIILDMTQRKWFHSFLMSSVWESGRFQIPYNVFF